MTLKKEISPDYKTGLRVEPLSSESENQFLFASPIMQSGLISFTFCLILLQFASTQRIEGPESLFQDYQAWRISQNPLVAYYLGYDFETTEVNDYSLPALEQRYFTAKNFSDRASTLLNTLGQVIGQFSGKLQFLKF